MGRDDSELIVGLDIGTTKICVVVGDVSDGKVNIIGMGVHPSVGLRKGVVVNIESTVNSISQAVQEAEMMAGCSISTVYVGIAGSHINGFNSHGLIAIKHEEIRKEDIERVVEAASAVPIPPDQKIIHVLPQEFTVDDHSGIQDPQGMTGVRLEANVHIVTGSVTSIHNIVKCCNQAGLEVAAVVLEQLASAEAVLTPEEMELGVALLDIGGGTSDLVIYVNGQVVHTTSVPVGGANISNDIAVGLRTPTAEADRLKELFGLASSSLVHKDETVEVPSVGGRSPRMISRKILCDIIEPRLKELLQMIHQELVASGYEGELNSGVVLTGGAALMEGFPEMAEQIFGCPVRRAYPSVGGGLSDLVHSPVYSTVLGLLVHDHAQPGISAGNRTRSRERNTEGMYFRMRNRMSGFFKEFF